MTRNMYMLTTKNPFYIANRPIPTLLQERYLEIFEGRNTPEDSCPFDSCCEECKQWSPKTGCHLMYKEGGI